VLVQLPVKVCERPDPPRFSVPPVPLIIRLVPFTLPVNVAVPPVLVIVISPAVANPSMLCEANVPVKVIFELPACNPREEPEPAGLNKLPFRVRLSLLVISVAPEAIVRFTAVFEPIILAPFRLTAPVPLIVTPPSPVKVPGHSALFTTLGVVPEVKY